MRYLWIFTAMIVVLTSAGTVGRMLEPVIQSASPAAEEMNTMSTPASMPDVVSEYVAALNAHDAQRAASLYSEDATVEQVILDGNTFQGRGEIAGWVSDNLSGLPDLEVTVASVVMDGDRVTWEWVYTGTYTGEFPGSTVGTGQDVTLRGISVMEVQDGLIASEKLYFDNYAFLTQVRALPPPGTPVSER